MTRMTKAAATAVAGLTLVCLTTASARPVAQGPTVKLVAQLGAHSTALDASPDPLGKVIYFTTGGAKPAIFSVPASGGKQTKVLSGGLLKRGQGLAVSNDGKRLYVADTKAGRILVVPVSGAKKPYVLKGTSGSAPRGLEIQTLGGKDFVVYTGKAADGSPAVLRISVAGAAKPSVVVKGAPLVNPDGVAISKTGAIYVTDHGLGGRALRIDGTTITTVASALKLGDPAGLALTFDESHLLISSLNKAAGTAQVVMVDLASGATSVFDDVISANHSAGGLHRARAAVPMGWADVQRPGRIYRVDP